MKRRTIAICVLIVILVCSGFLAWMKHFNKGPRKYDLESEFARYVYKAVVASPLDGESPTSWSQISPIIRTQAWIRLEQDFLQYSEAIRGFKTSLWEKYVFVEPGVKVPDQSWTSGGDVVMLQIAGGAGFGSKRFVIWRNPSGYEIANFHQSSIEDWFSKAGKGIPKPSNNLAPATPPGWQPPSDPARSGHVFLLVSSVLFGALCVFLLWHSRRHETG